MRTSAGNHPHIYSRLTKAPNLQTRNSWKPLLAIRILRVSEGVLDLGLASISCAGEEIVAHGNSNLANDVDEVVVKDHVCPALATIDGEAFRSLAIWCFVSLKLDRIISY